MERVTIKFKHLLSFFCFLTRHPEAGPLVKSLTFADPFEAVLDTFNEWGQAKQMTSFGLPSLPKHPALEVRSGILNLGKEAQGLCKYSLGVTRSLIIQKCPILIELRFRPYSGFPLSISIDRPGDRKPVLSIQNVEMMKAHVLGSVWKCSHVLSILLNLSDLENGTFQRPIAMIQSSSPRTLQIKIQMDLKSRT